MDLPIGIAFANCTHAAGESVDSKVESGTNAIVLAAYNEAHLAHIAAKLEDSPLKFTCIHEPDLPYDGALMAIGISPVLRSIGKKYLSSLPLVKEEMFLRARSSNMEQLSNKEVVGVNPT